MNCAPPLRSPTFPAAWRGRTPGAHGPRILIVGINYAPEKLGIGPYTTELAQHLAACGYRIEAIVAKPYYPDWRIDGRFKAPGYRVDVERGVRVTRTPLYVPATPSGVKRILHHLSFALAVLPPLVTSLLVRRPTVVLTIAPSMMAAPLVRVMGKAAGAKTWLHVQDFEVGAAQATGLVPGHGPWGALARAFERVAYAGFDARSSISPPMCGRLRAMAKPSEQTFELRNWADVAAVRPAPPGRSPYRRLWKITAPHVALYSGNMANKQGLEMVVEAARRLSHRRDILFVLCGDGPAKSRLVELAHGLDNIRFYPLQPRRRLDPLLALASVHLLPQIRDAADLVLPSKLTNMLASGRPSVVAAAPDTGVAYEARDCAILTPPEDGGHFAEAVVRLVDDPALAARYGANARARAIERWSKDMILGRLAARLQTWLNVPIAEADATALGDWAAASPVAGNAAE